MQKKCRSPRKDGRSGASREERAWAANLPTSFRKTGDLHPEHGSTGTRNRRTICRTRKVFLASRPASKLHCQSLAFEVTAICSRVVSKFKSGLIRFIIVTKLRSHTESWNGEARELAELGNK